MRRARRPKRSKLTSGDRLRAVVEAKLELRWSPQQISGWLVRDCTNNERGTTRRSRRPGRVDHWEGDLLMGKRMHAMATLVERKTRFVMLIALPDGHAADVVADALAAKIVELPEQLRRSLT